MEVVAHRGASQDLAEHTLAAYRRAVEVGADGLECDIRLTADGVPVCVHDRRVDSTSNGRGPVSSLEYADLAELDFSVRRRAESRAVARVRGLTGRRSVPVSAGEAGHEEPDVAEDGRVLTLEALLAYVHDCGRRVEVAIETKHPTRYAGLVERRLVEVLDRYGWGHPRRGQEVPVRVMSFSWLSLRRMHVLAPSIATVQLLDRVPLRLWDGSLPVHVGVAGPRIEVVRAHPRYVERVHRKGGAVHVWTVDEPVDVDLCLRLGVDAIITNRPAEVLSLLDAARTAAEGRSAAG